MEKYLYGASVQGIQGFIFETNKLREIVGASELVEQICTSEFEKFCSEKCNHTIEDDSIIMRAAGKIKYIVDRDVAQKIVREFPMHIRNFAPGITINQAAVSLSHNFKYDIDELEIRLKSQRNKAEMPLEIGFMGLKRAQKTGKVAFSKDRTSSDEKEIIDIGSETKRNEESKRLFADFTGKKEHDLKKEHIPKDIEKLTGKADSSWLAIIHADGNGVGSIIQNLANSISSNEDARKAFKTFSLKLEVSTKEAVKIAFDKVIDKKWQLKIENSVGETYPLRPVVLGGDDMTVIIRADLAYNFTVEFLKSFEIRTKENFKDLEVFGLKDKYLTACAGIAYIKDNYPFHYGVHLAESLVKEAKKFSKTKDVQGDSELPPSSFSFYKVQSSFIEELSEMRKRTHYAVKSNTNFDFGPYLLHKIDGMANVAELDTLLNKLSDNKTDKSKGVSKLRQWISELYLDKSKAKFMLDRIKSINGKFYTDLQFDNYASKDHLIYNDLIQLHTFNSIYDDNKL
jgi:hypothetical protein